MANNTPATITKNQTLSPVENLAVADVQGTTSGTAINAVNTSATVGPQSTVGQQLMPGLNANTTSSGTSAAGLIVPGGDCQVIITNKNHSAVEWADAKLSGAFLGEVRMLSDSDPLLPSGWIRCDGQILSVSGYAALGAKLGNKYGGDGTTTFGIPDLNAVHTSGRFAPLTYIMATESCATSPTGDPVIVPGGSGVPIGTIISFGGTIQAVIRLKSQGWYLCNGQSVPLVGVDLANFNDAVGTTYGTYSAPNGVVLPDLQGYFLRGVSGSSGKDPDAANRIASGPNSVGISPIGSKQEDAFQGHWHNLRADPKLTPAVTGLAVSIELAIGKPTGWATDPAQDDLGSGSPRTSAETRPKNAYVYWLIKVW